MQTLEQKINAPATWALKGLFYNMTRSLFSAPECFQSNIKHSDGTIREKLRPQYLWHAQQPGIEPPTLPLVDDLLHLLTCSYPRLWNNDEGEPSGIQAKHFSTSIRATEAATNKCICWLTFDLVINQLGHLGNQSLELLQVTSLQRDVRRVNHSFRAHVCFRGLEIFPGPHKPNGLVVLVVSVIAEFGVHAAPYWLVSFSQWNVGLPDAVREFVFVARSSDMFLFFIAWADGTGWNHMNQI